MRKNARLREIRVDLVKLGLAHEAIKLKRASLQEEWKTLTESLADNSRKQFLNSMNIEPMKENEHEPTDKQQSVGAD